MGKKIYYIKGMDCNEEVIVLKKELAPLVGTDENLSFDLMNARLTVDLPADSEVGSEDICRAISRTGLKAVPWEEHGALQETHGFGFWALHGRAVMCFAGGILLASGFLIHVVSHGFLDALVGGEEGIHAFPVASTLLYLSAVAAGGWFIAPKALLSAKKLRPDMSLLMTIAVIGAIILGELFEASAVTFLFALSLLLESWSIRRARRAIGALIDLSPATARFKKDDDDTILESPVDDVPIGSIVIIRPGEKIPLDGIVTGGSTAVNQAPITGESLPIDKSMGDEVFAGTINGDGAIEVRSTKPAHDTTIARIIRMVDEAHSRRSPSEQWVEKFARYYTPVMMALAVLIALIPPIATGGPWQRWIYEALVILVIACPCALVISTPVSIVAALAAAAKAGVLVKGGVYMEAPAHLNAIALDKTGTLTYGKPAVLEIIPMDDHTEYDLLRCAAALEIHSTHPLAHAVVNKAEAQGLPVVPAEEFSIIQGKGAEGTIDGRKYWLGSHRFMHEKGKESPEFHSKAEALEAEGKSVVAIGTDEHVCGIISVADGIRDQTRSVIKDLKNLGLERVVMLTGDNKGTAASVARTIEVDDYKSDLLPEDKVHTIEELVKRYKHVAMVGDGVNDAPALASATLGIAMGAAGSDAAIETADISLMSDDLTKIPWLIGYSRRTLRVIKQNIAFALGLKLIFIFLALMGLATLWMAIAADMGATFVVILNGLRLLNGKA